MSRIELPLQTSGRRPVVSAMLIVAFVTLGAIAVALSVWRHPPTDATVVPLTIAFFAVMCFSPFALIRIISRRHVYVDDGDLLIVTGVGKKRVALANLRARGIDVVDLKQRSELVPRLRVFGASMPGLNAGWFKLRNGEKAFCIVTEQNRVSYLRSATDNVSVLLSLENPEQLKALLDR